MAERYLKLSALEEQQLLLLAQDIDANPDDLYSLIDFESGWDPKVKNPRSSARGLVQFMDSTAKGMGYTGGSLDLVNQHPDRISQMRGPVKTYLTQWAPYRQSKQRLYLAVFYPAARDWSPTKAFPDSVTRANPGISTPLDYMAYVDAKANGTTVAEAKKNLGANQVAMAGVGPLAGGAALMMMGAKNPAFLFLGGCLVAWGLFKR